MNNSEENNVKPYHATSNLNVLLSNPTFQSGNMVDSNFNNSAVNNSMGSMTYNMPNESTNNLNNEVKQNQMNIVTPNDIPNNIPPKENVVNDSNLDVTEKAYQEVEPDPARTIKNTTYISNMAPIKEEKKKTFKVSKDTISIIVMLLIIFIFIMILPTLSKIIRGIR